MAAHSSLTGADLHEAKGYDTATSGQVRVADGAGGGSMVTVHGGLNQYVFTMHIQDASSATAALNSAYLAMPFPCTVNLVQSVAYAAIATTDNILTVANNGGSSMGTITVAFTGSAIGDVDSLTPASNNTFTLGQKMSVISNSGSATACPMTITVLATRTG